MQAETSRSGCYAVKVRPRVELAVGRALRLKGFDILLPSYVDRRRYSDRLKHVSCALFPGYIFVRMKAEELLPIVSTVGVSYLVRSGNTLQPLPLEDVAVLEVLCGVDTGCEPCPNFSVGTRVSIESGPLRGLQGIVARVGQSERVVISINTVFKSVSVDLRNTTVKTIN